MDGLFDLKADEGQLTNIAQTDTARLAQMKALFADRTEGFYRPFVEEVTLK